MPVELAAAQRRFFTLFGGGLAVVVLAWLLPKPPVPNSAFRLFLTFAFFAGACAALFALAAPLRLYLSRLSGWRYQNCPGTVERWRRDYLDAIDRIATPLSYAMLVFVIACAVKVLSAWPAFAFLRPFPSSLAQLLGLAAIGFVVVSRGQWLIMLFEYRRRLASECEVYQFTPRVPLIKAAADAGAPAVQVIGDHKFRAGGFDWSWEDVQRNAIVFGKTGTGKTVCVLNALVEGLLTSGGNSLDPPSALILDPKGEFESIAALCEEIGRSQDLLVLDPSDPECSIRWNPFDSDDDEIELASRFVAVLEANGMKGANDQFWLDTCRVFIRHAIALFRDTGGQDGPPDAPRILELAAQRDRVAEQGVLASPAAADACAYFAHQWLELPPETEGGIKAYLRNLLDLFTLEPYRTIFSGHSTMRLGDMIDQGKILYIKLRLHDREAMAKIVLTLLKLEYQREVLKRVGKRRFSLFLCDEFQTVLTAGEEKGDANFFSLSRGSRHANLIATQSLQGLYRRSPKMETVHDLLSNCAVKIFLHGDDKATNTFASELFGQGLATLPSSGINVGGGMARPSKISVSLTGQPQDYPVVRPDDFLRLKSPSQERKFTESIAQISRDDPAKPHWLKWPIHPLPKAPPFARRS